MSEKLPPLAPHKTKTWTEWLGSVENADLLRGSEPEENQGNAIQLLPRSNIGLYGIYPKMEPRVYVVCNDCSKLIRPYEVSPHSSQCKATKKEQAETPGSSGSVKKKSSHTKSKKKSILPKNVPPPPLFPWFSTQCAKEGATPTASTPQVSPAPPSVQEAPSGGGGSSSSSSRHKKAKKQATKGTKERDDPEKHGAVLAHGDRGSHKHSSRSSHHSGSGKKTLPSKSSKSSHHHGGEKKHAKDAAKPAVSQLALANPPKSAPDIVPATAAETAAVAETVSAQIDSASTSATEAPTSRVETPMTTTVESPAEPAPPSDSALAVKAVPIVLMPMNPVAVVSPIQVIQLSLPVLHLSSPQQTASSPLPGQPIVVSIPDQHSGVKLYNTHPKPLMMPTMANRKIGNTVLLQKQRLEQQRNKIDVALNCKTFSLLNTMHRPNILKCRGMKVNLKRPASDKPTTNECKNTRLTPDVNGFILHADVSESAEAPQPDNSIHEKIALMNLK